jgi:hypothetical protein
VTLPDSGLRSGEGEGEVPGSRVVGRGQEGERYEAADAGECDLDAGGHPQCARSERLTGGGVPAAFGVVYGLSVEDGVRA